MEAFGSHVMTSQDRFGSRVANRTGTTTAFVETTGGKLADTKAGSRQAA